jgi:hypothetical protein
MVLASGGPGGAHRLQPLFRLGRVADWGSGSRAW